MLVRSPSTPAPLAAALATDTLAAALATAPPLAAALATDTFAAALATALADFSPQPDPPALHRRSHSSMNASLPHSSA